MISNVTEHGIAFEDIGRTSNIIEGNRIVVLNP
jgi:hypothetical protein